MIYASWRAISNVIVPIIANFGKQLRRPGWGNCKKCNDFFPASSYLFTQSCKDGEANLEGLLGDKGSISVKNWLDKLVNHFAEIGSNDRTKMPHKLMMRQSFSQLVRSLWMSSNIFEARSFAMSAFCSPISQFKIQSILYAAGRPAELGWLHCCIAMFSRQSTAASECVCASGLPDYLKQTPTVYLLF